MTTSLRLSYSATLRAALLAAAAGLSGCAAIGDSAVSQAFVDPARYELFNCEQLSAERKALDARLAQLDALMRKAETGVAGSVVSEVAYRNDYINVKAMSRLAEQTWRDRKCTEAAPPAIPAVPAVAHPTARPGRAGR